MIRINLLKKLTKVSTLFMLLSLIALWLIAIYNANFKITGYELIINYTNIIKEFLLETNEVILLVAVILVIILAILEVDNNVASFDAFYVVYFGRMNFHHSKLIAYFLIIWCYLSYLYLGITLIYLWRFQNNYYLQFIAIMYFNTIIYIYYLFIISFNLVLISKSHFSATIVILIYWGSKMFINHEADKYLKFIILRLNFNYISFDFGFEIKYLYVIINLVVQIAMNYFIYAKKDLKC